MAKKRTVAATRRVDNAPNQDDLDTLKEKAVELLSQDRSRLLMKMPFVGSLLMRLELVPVRDKRLLTAATDGDHVFVDIGFYSSLTLEERLFVLAHETWHCALVHFVRRQGREKRRFDVAADLEVQFLMEEEGFKIPFVIPFDPKWKGLSCEEIYERFPDDESDANLEEGTESVHIKAGQSGEGKGFDCHIQKEDFVDGDDIGEDIDYTPAVSQGAEERCRERLSSAVQQYQRIKGELPAGLSLAVNEVLQPELDWRELLAQFVTSCYGGSRRWLPPSRRHVWQGLYLQSMRSERLKACVAVDTSGSCVGDLPRFFSELTSLLGTFGNYEVMVIQCDAKIGRVEAFSSDKPLPKEYGWKVTGGGGTSFVPVFDYIKEHGMRPDVFIYVTDGYGDAPEKAPPYPVMWVLTSEGSEDFASWGWKIHLSNH